MLRDWNRINSSFGTALLLASMVLWAVSCQPLTYVDEEFPDLEGLDLSDLSFDVSPGDAESDADSGEVCSDDEEDEDEDGVCDRLDACPDADDTLDDDSDGVPDACDVCPGSDDRVDDDEDEVPNGCDLCPNADDADDADEDSIPDDCDCDSEDICHENAFCTPAGDEGGDVTCECHEGYIGNGIEACDDINECDSEEFPCHEDAECENSDGSYECGCEDGYASDDPRSLPCVDINECDGEDHGCFSDDDCANEPEGSWTCTCPDGYEDVDEDGLNCREIDECSEGGHDCVSDDHCHNLPLGSWTCGCPTGFEDVEGDGTSCREINECTEEEGALNDCSFPDSCTNTPIGSYSCECEEGYEDVGEDGKNCRDIDECSEAGGSLNDCSFIDRCANSPAGSYSCTCPDGYEDVGDDGKSCREINECTESSGSLNDCPFPELCSNTDGSHECACPGGYEDVDEDGMNCRNIDECTENGGALNGCTFDELCVDTVGGYTCTCRSGYENVGDDGKNCREINECTESSGSLNDCSFPELCTNTAGSHECACAGGYEDVGDDGKNCREINECTEDDYPHGCDQAHNCTNTTGSNECSCDSGYHDVDGDGSDCDEIDECVQEWGSDHGCDADIHCTNTIGGYECSCPIGDADGTIADPCPLTITIILEGAGAGTVTDGDTIVCGVDGDVCVAIAEDGDTITLDAEAIPGSAFDAWDGADCTGETCQFTMGSESIEITAGFDLVNNLVFVTSEPIIPSTLGGDGDPLAAADGACMDLASEAGLPGTYRAWLSTSTVDARDRLALDEVAAVGWIRTDGLPFALSRDALLAGEVLYPIVLDELGDAHNTAAVLTNTNPDGTKLGSDCTNFTNGGQPTATGRAGTGTGQWTSLDDPACSAEARLYCFGVDAPQSPTAPSNTGLYAFLGTDFKPGVTNGGGFAGAAQLCEDQARNEGLPGVYRTLLGSPDVPVADRILAIDQGQSYPTETWIRPDGVLVSETSAELFSEDLLAPMTMTADGDYLDTRVFATTSLSSTSANDCSRWEGTSGSGVTGHSAATNSRFYTMGGYGCSSALPVYCLQIPCYDGLCADGATCSDETGCSCASGWFSSDPDSVACQDDNECNGEGIGHNCDHDNHCTNTPGSWTCSCPVGDAAGTVDDPCPLTVTITVVGDGAGTVSDDDEISCSADGGTCSVIVDESDVISLTATAANGSMVGSWQGIDCAGTSCEFTVGSTSVDITISFELTSNIVFVTSTTVMPSALGTAPDDGQAPLDTADGICNHLATSAGLGGTYVAWLSTSSASAGDRLMLSEGEPARGWMRPDGLPVALTKADLLAGEILYPITLDENGVARNDSTVLTNTSESGTGLSSHCSNFTVSTGQTRSGRSGTGAGYWTSIGSPSCGASARLYCFGIDSTNSPAAPSNDGLTAFVATDFSPGVTHGGGHAGADQLCEDQARVDGIDHPGVYRALLASTTETIRDRFFGEGAYPSEAWVRPDGVIIAETTEELFTSHLLAPISVTADGTFLSGTRAWVGGTVASIAGDGSTCANWFSSGADYGTSGNPVETGGGFYSGQGSPCSTGAKAVYCMQVPCYDGLCADNAQCSDLTGCSCAAGWTSTDPDSVACTVEDWCVVRGLTCGTNATCGETGGCFCPDGYTGDPEDEDPGGGCVETDECELDTDNCVGVGVCTNEPLGSFTCSCPDGYTGSGTDADPCVGGLTVNLLGTGAGTVKDLLGTIVCGLDGEICSANPDGSVTLTAYPFAGTTFGGWVGDGWIGPSCTDTSCTFTVGDDPVVVNATFTMTNNLVFVTSGTIVPAELGTLGEPAAALTAADAFCQTSADEAGLPGTYAAWLSSAEQGAVERTEFTTGTGGWLRTDGRPFALSLGDLTSNGVLYPISLDENGALRTNANVLTNTNASGTKNGKDCNDFTDGEANSRGGKSGAGAERWTSINIAPCDSNLPLYCFGIDAPEGLTAPTANDGLVAFVTNASFSPGVTNGGGLAGADALCESEARTSSHPGVYRALLGVTATSTLDRLLAIDQGQSYPTQNWVRPDGILVTETSQDLFSDLLLAPMSVTSSGSIISSFDAAVWGASSLTSTATSTCSDWAETSGTGTTGTALYTHYQFRSGGGSGCSGSKRLYCLQIPCRDGLCAAGATCSDTDGCTCPVGSSSSDPDSVPCTAD